MEKVYVNEVVQAQRKVTGNVKKHTSAVYLTMKDKVGRALTTLHSVLKIPLSLSPDVNSLHRRK